MNHLQLLQAALHSTEQMLAAAEQGQWARIAELEAVRASQLQQVFPLAEDEENEALRPVLEQLVALNQQVEQLCRSARQSLQTELSRFTQKKQAAAAYRSV